MSSSTATSPSRASFDSTQSLPTLITFLNSVPPQLIALLAEFGPYIARIRWITEAMSWKAAYSDSWLLLGAWWAICLFSEITFRYLLLLVAVAAYVWLSYNSPSRSRPLVTEQSLQSTVIDLSVIEALLPSTPQLQVVPWNTLARVFAVLYAPTLILIHFVRIKVLLGIFGTIVFVWRAPWARTIRGALWRSAWFRRGLLRIWARVSGHSPSQAFSASSSYAPRTDSIHSLRFLFMVYENQRWWVGLDWTAALIPGERPSWCSATQEPMAPPSAFTLPGPTCVYLSDKKGGLVKRTATWSWDEGEWKVVVKKDVGTKRVEKELPVLKEDQSPHASRLGRAKQKAYEIGMKVKTQQDGDHGDEESLKARERDETHSDSTFLDDTQDSEADDPNTDNDGWVYGDNKWKALSSAGGLGKYTRYRRWSRIALLTEEVEPASAEEARNHAARQHEVNERVDPGSRRSLDGPPQQRESDANSMGSDNGEKDGLKKRLKAAIRKSTSNS